MTEAVHPTWDAEADRFDDEPTTACAIAQFAVQLAAWPGQTC